MTSRTSPKDPLPKTAKISYLSPWWWEIRQNAFPNQLGGGGFCGRRFVSWSFFGGLVGIFDGATHAARLFLKKRLNFSLGGGGHAQYYKLQLDRYGLLEVYATKLCCRAMELSMMTIWCPQQAVQKFQPRSQTCLKAAYFMKILRQSVSIIYLQLCTVILL